MVLTRVPTPLPPVRTLVPTWGVRTLVLAFGPNLVIPLRTRMVLLMLLAEPRQALNLTTSNRRRALGRSPLWLGHVPIIRRVLVGAAPLASPLVRQPRMLPRLPPSRLVRVLVVPRLDPLLPLSPPTLVPMLLQKPLIHLRGVSPSILTRVVIPVLLAVVPVIPVLVVSSVLPPPRVLRTVPTILLLECFLINFLKGPLEVLVNIMAGNFCMLHRRVSPLPVVPTLPDRLPLCGQLSLIRMKPPRVLPRKLGPSNMPVWSRT